jgi:hygromycin-B 4-O-kinase
MALECALMTRLNTMGLPIPACEYREVRSRGVHLIDRVEGEGLTALDADEPRMVAALGWVAAFLARLHEIRGNGFGPLSAASDGRLIGLHGRWADYVCVRLDDHISACKAAGDVSMDEALEITSLFTAHRRLLEAQPSALLHGDPGSHNFIVDASRIRGVIDWEDALLGDPLFDLASLCTFHPERRHAAMLSGYGAHLDSATEPFTRFWLYFLRIALARTVHRRRFAYADRPDRPPAARRIQLALERLRA